MHKIILLNSIEKVKMFVHICNKYNDLYIDLKSGRYIIDGKSIMGVFSLDLSKPINLTTEGDASVFNEFLEEIKEYIIEE